MWDGLWMLGCSKGMGKVKLAHGNLGPFRIARWAEIVVDIFSVKSCPVKY